MSLETCKSIYIQTIQKMLRIHADELGIDPLRDKGIFACFRRDAIHSASLMVIGNSAENAVTQAKAMILPLYLHLQFKTDNYVQETQEQLELFKRWTGFYPTRVDGYQNAHVAKGVPEIIAPVLQKAGVVFTRIPDENIDILHWIDEPTRLSYESQYVQMVKARLVYAHYGIRAPDKTYDIGLKGKEMTLERIQYILDNVEGNIELVVHPGFCAPDTQDKSPLYECRVLYSRIKN